MVLIITAVFPPEPVVSAKLSYDLASELSSRHNVNVISPRPSRPFGFKFEPITEKFTFKHKIIESYVCPKSSHFGRLRESISFGRASAKYISENQSKVEAIYLNTWPLFAQYFVVREAKKYNIPLIIHIQDIYPESLTNKYRIVGIILKKILLPIDKYILKNSYRLVVISEKMGDYLIKTRGLDSSKVHTIPNWQDESTFLSRKAIGSLLRNDRPFTFMYLGNIGPVAGIELLINAFIKTKLVNSRLVIAGSGSMKANAIKSASKFPAKGIEFWDVPDGMVAEIQAEADVLMLPVKKGVSISSIPSKLPAYMFSAKPILASVTMESDIAEVISRSGCGWVVPPEDEMALIRKMREVSSLLGSTLSVMGNSGRMYALAHFSKGSNLKKLVDILENLARP